LLRLKAALILRGSMNGSSVSGRPDEIRRPLLPPERAEVGSLIGAIGSSTVREGPLVGWSGECACGSSGCGYFAPRERRRWTTWLEALFQMPAFGQAMLENSRMWSGACWKENATTSFTLSKKFPCTPMPREKPSAITILMRPSRSPASQYDWCKISWWN
jgi:hypothetical protein